MLPMPRHGAPMQRRLSLERVGRHRSSERTLFSATSAVHSNGEQDRAPPVNEDAEQLLAAQRLLSAPGGAAADAASTAAASAGSSLAVGLTAHMRKLSTDEIEQKLAAAGLQGQYGADGELLLLGLVVAEVVCGWCCWCCRCCRCCWCWCWCWC